MPTTRILATGLVTAFAALTPAAALAKDGDVRVSGEVHRGPRRRS